MQRHTKPLSTIVIHCSATPEDYDVTAGKIRRWHLERGWDDIGYHYVVRLDGTVEKGRPVTMQGAHVRGHNDGTIGVCYVGGVWRNGKPADTRTPAQKRALLDLIVSLQNNHGPLSVVGHRDFPGVAKACPSFDARAEYATLTAARAAKPKEKTMETDAKFLGKSKTFWFNVVSGAASLTALFGFEVSPDTVATVTTVGMVVGNVILRLVTKQPVRL